MSPFPQRAPRLSRGRWIGLALLSACAPADAPDAVRREGPSPVRFVEVAEESGIDFVHTDGSRGEFYYAEVLAAGAIFFDAEGDGDPDLYLTNGRPLGLPIAEDGPRNAFYLNDGSGHFTEAGAAAGLDDPRFSSGVCGGDYDNDGDVDLYVANFPSGNALYRNDGGGRFTDVAAEAGVLGTTGFASSCAFADVDGDGWLDLYVGYCLDHSPERNLVCHGQRRDGSGEQRRYCNPSDYNPVPDVLYRNRGDGTFEDVTEAWGSTGLGRTLGVAFADYDDDGDQDLFVACDRTANLYYENVEGRAFREIAMTTGTALSEAGQPQAGMGAVSGDFDGDGRIDLAVTYFERERNGFYRNLGGNRFVDTARVSGTAEASLKLLGWGVEFFDADLDGDLDVYVVNGHVIDNAHLFRRPLAGYEQPNLFFLNLGDGRFESLGPAAGPALEIERVGRGLAVADVDGDGDLDALVANRDGAPELLRNDSPRAGRHWLLVRLVGTRSNRDGIGARVVAELADGRRLVREVRSGQSYLSQSDLRVHFGLDGEATLPALEVRWPSGLRTRLEDVAADRVLEVVEPSE